MKELVEQKVFKERLTRFVKQSLGIRGFPDKGLIRLIFYIPDEDRFSHYGDFSPETVSGFKLPYKVFQIESWEEFIEKNGYPEGIKEDSHLNDKIRAYVNEKFFNEKEVK